MEYNKRLTEVNELLNSLDELEYKKIPIDVIEEIQKNKDDEHIWNLDKNKSIDEQNINKDTLAIFSSIYAKYLVDDVQKEAINSLLKDNEENVAVESSNPEEFRMIIYKEKLYSKVWKFAKRIFSRKEKVYYLNF